MPDVVADFLQRGDYGRQRSALIMDSQVGDVFQEQRSGLLFLGNTSHIKKQGATGVGKAFLLASD